MSDASFNLSKEIELLRREFAEKLIERKAAMADAVAILEASDDANDDARRRQATSDLEEIAHNLSGSGALFGFADLGTAAGALEAACEQVRKSPSPTAEAEVLARWADFKSVAEAL